VRKILADHYVQRNQSELVKSTIRETGRYKIIDKVSVSLNDKDDRYEAEFANLGIKGVVVESGNDQRSPEAPRRRRVVHLRHRVLPQRRRPRGPVDSRLLKPIQLSNFDFEGYTHLTP
jgi:ATP-dependent Lon protease